MFYSITILIEYFFNYHLSEWQAIYVWRRKIRKARHRRQSNNNSNARIGVRRQKFKRTDGMFYMIIH